MAITCTLSMSPNVIAGQPARGMLAITNGAGSDVTVSSISPVVQTPNSSIAVPPPAALPYAFRAPAFPPNATSTVTASGGVLQVPVEFVFYVPQMAGSFGTLVTPGSTYLVSLMVQVSDGSQASPFPQWVAVSSGAPSPSQGYGQFRFDDGRQLINLAAL